MPRIFTSIITTLILMALIAGGLAQTVPNPKLSQADLEAARAATREVGGAEAEVTYAARIDAVEKGAFDSLVVIYAKPGKADKDYFALVVREDKKYRLTLDQADVALKRGDRFLRIGLRHEEGKAPLLRLMGATTTEPGKPGEWQHNFDFQFNGTEFVLIAQSMAPMAK
jgi:hypothetical protein